MIGYASKFHSFVDNYAICNRSLECMWTHGSTNSDVIRAPRRNCYAVLLRLVGEEVRLHVDKPKGVKDGKE